MLPATTLAALCLHGGWPPSATSRERFLRLGQMLVPFLLGVALPLAVFIMPYLRASAIHDLFAGAFALSSRPYHPPPEYGLQKLLATAALVYLLAAATSIRIRFGRLARTVVVVFLAVVLITSAHHPRVLALAWSPLVLLVPLSVLAAAMTLAHRETALGLNPLHRQQFMLMVTVAALASLIQIPFSAAIYFCYAAPLLLLSLLALLSTRLRRSGFLLVTLGTFCLAFVVLRITPSFLHTIGNYYQPDRQSHRLNLYRTGGLRIDPQEAEVYERLIPLVQQHAAGTSFTYCGPDCPEVYFLAGLQNPTRVLLDFLDEPAGHTQRMLQAIDSHDIRVLVIQTTPPLSRPMPQDLQTALRERFPEFTTIGRFEVRWRR